MFKLGDDLVISASDLRLASECEFALLRTVDEKLGRVEVAQLDDDPVRGRAAELGDRHEAQELGCRVRDLGRATGLDGRGVYEVSRPRNYTRASLEAAADETFEALRAGHPVVFQACFYDGRFHGYADFLIRDPAFDEPTYTVADTKLARTTRVPALLQIAAYADQLRTGGIRTTAHAQLILGDNSVHDYPLADIVPVFRERWERLLSLTDQHRSRPQPAQWGDERFVSCGRCDRCVAEAELSDDVLLVAGMRVSQRKKLRAAGIETVAELAASTGPVPDVSARSLAAVRAQAALQVRGRAAPPGEVLYEVFDPRALHGLPAPSPGDIFFDFEGDPMWLAPTDRPGAEDWGLEYLFGVMEAAPREEFRPFWAHTRQAEREALEAFMAYVAERRAQHPDLHIYHYAAYEKSALTRLAARHRTREDDVDQLLREGVLVDLYAVVRSSLRVSADSYSIKALEPLYMGWELRTGEVKSAGESIVEYANYCAAVELGDTEAAARTLDGIEDYNRYDCLSTLRLRDWLLDRAEAAGTPLDTGLREQPEPPASVEPDDVEEQLWALAGRAGDRTPEQQAYALLAASRGYNARERKPFWWAHFDRLTNPADEWADTRDVFAVSSADQPGPWEKPTPASRHHRKTRLVGSFGPGSTVGVGTKLQAVYDAPVPDGITVPTGSARGWKGGAKLTEHGPADGGREYVVVDEILPLGAAPYDQVPMALVPEPPPKTDSIDRALAELGSRALGGLQPQPGLDVLIRRPPRFRVLGRLPAPGAGGDGAIDAIEAALLDLDSSYLAVQGPPGTGKTHVGGHVVRRLVEQHGWRVGVVGQSHAVVENFLGCLERFGLDPGLIAKKGKRDDAATWTDLPHNGHAAFLTDHADSGCVIGGTAWDLTNEARIARQALDLLVIDEAGQFSLATTLAVSVAAQRLLLLGDPQQLPQVVQGTHPEPVDQSALGWLIEGRATLPRERGYFLDTSWRMHPRICAAVSTLSYAGELRSKERRTRSRSLEGVEPGVEVVQVPHRANSVESAEEAAEVVRQVRDLVGRRWTDPAEGPEPRRLRQADILVVAPYNAQVNLISRQLADAGFADVPVGSVDRFQGQEAAVVIVSMTASAQQEVPRGMGFLLNRNRVNVSVSRGKWKSIVVRSPLLTEFAPATPRELLELGAFIGLCQAADGSPSERG